MSNKSIGENERVPKQSKAVRDNMKLAKKISISKRVISKLKQEVRSPEETDGGGRQSNE